MSKKRKRQGKKGNERGEMLLEEACTQSIIIQSSCWVFCESSAVLQWCHNRGWNLLFLLRRELTMEHSAGGDPDPLIVMWQPWPSQQEKEDTAQKCMLAIPPPPPLSDYSPSTIWIQIRFFFLMLQQHLSVISAPLLVNICHNCAQWGATCPYTTF